MVQNWVPKNMYKHLPGENDQNTYTTKVTISESSECRVGIKITNNFVETLYNLPFGLQLDLDGQLT